MEDHKKTQTALIIIGIITFIIVIIIISLLIRNVKTEKKEEIIEAKGLIYLDIYPRTEFIYNEIDYTVKRVGYIIQEGMIRQGVIERINDLKNDTNYTISLEHDLFYPEEQTCNTVNPICDVKIEKIGDVQLHIIKIKEDFYRLIVYVENGYIKKPTICIAENSEKLKNNTLKTETNLELMEIPVPYEHRLFYDKCYRLSAREEIYQLLLSQTIQKYEGEIKKYNKKHKTKYTTFENVTYTDNEYNNYPRKSLFEGFHHYNLKFTNYPEKNYHENDKISVLLTDSFTKTIKKNLNIT